MQLFDECFLKVKTDCFKFISSQETKNEKFKNKDRMIRSFLIPVCFWIAKKTNKKEPLIIGLAGGQGTGKTTITSIISIILKKYFKLDIFKISIDDFYKTRKQRTLLSKNKHSLLMTRGVPGTHDIDIMLNFFKKIKVKKFKILKLPKFNKGVDDRCKQSLWYKIQSKPDVVILEGWCVGARSQNSKELKKPVNSFVAQFIGENNQLKGKVKSINGNSCVITTNSGEDINALKVNVNNVGDVSTISLRPERVAINSAEKFENVFDAKIKELIYLGDHIRTRVEICGNDQFIVKVPNSYKDSNLKEGSTVKLSWKASDSRALDLS